MIQALLLKARRADANTHDVDCALSVYKRILEVEPRQFEAMLEYQEILIEKVEKCSNPNRIDGLLDQFLEGTYLFERTDDDEVNSLIVQKRKYRRR